MGAGTPKPATGEMRRLHEAILRSGALAKVGAPGRLVFAYGLCFADYGKCTFTMSARGGAKVCGAGITTFTRGIAQLREAGILQVGPEAPGGRRKYRFVVPPKRGRTQGVLGAHTQCVTPPDTQCVRGAHRVC